MALDLTEILKDAPKGTPLYSTVHGEVAFKYILSDDRATYYPIVVYKESENVVFAYTKEGLYQDGYNGECNLFPSRENRDWSTFKINKPYKVGDYLLRKATNKVYKIVEIHPSDKYDIEPLTTKIGTYPKFVNLLAKVLEMDFAVCERFPSDTLRPFTRVLVRDMDNIRTRWHCELFSNLVRVAGKLRAVAGVYTWDECIPYNSDTEYLVGTADEAPEFYRQTK